MDTEHPYVGEHTPQVKLSARPTRTESSKPDWQCAKGRSYSGRIVLAGTPGTAVKVTLAWGDAAEDRQTVTHWQVRGRTTGSSRCSFQGRGRQR